MSAPKSRTQEAVVVSAATLAYFAACQIGFFFPSSAQLVMEVWPAAGVGLAALLLNPRRRWPWLVVAFFSVGLLANVGFAGKAVLEAVGYMLANMAESVGCALLIERVGGAQLRFARVREVVALLVAAVAVNAASACIGAFTAVLVGPVTLASAWRSWYISDGLGILIIAPLIVTWARSGAGVLQFRLTRRGEAVGFLLVWCAVSWLSLNSARNGDVFALQPYMLIALLAWPAFRLGQHVVSSAMVLLAAISILDIKTHLDAGVSGAPLANELLAVQLFLAFAAFTGYLLTATYAESRESELKSLANQEQLARSEHELREAERVAHVGHWKWETTTNQVFWSDEMKRMWGLDPQVVHDDLAAVIAERVHPDDKARVDASNDAVLGEGRPAPLEYRIVVPERGVRTIFAVPGAARRDETGKVLELTGVVQDVTEARQAEAERAALQMQLIQAQKMESVGRLAGGVAHDFNNMLGVIIGHADFALQGVKPDDPTHEALVEILAAGRRSAELTRQLLAFARRQFIAPKVVDVNEHVASSLKMLQRLIGEDVGLTWKPAPVLWPTLIDPSQLDQILANLCVNARDAISDVGTVTVSTTNCHLEARDCADITDAVPGDYVRLTVRDSGTGIAPDVLSQIFEPFFTTKGVGEGTGLGLATVYGAVRQNNGFVTVSSELGHGAAFDIYLPRYVSEEEQRDAGPNATAPMRGHETILLVEDEPSLLQLTKMGLEAYGYTVLAAAGPMAALQLAETHEGAIDLIVTDLVMPAMNGRDLVARVAERRPQIRQLFMSGFPGARLSDLSPRDRERLFIEKPFSQIALAARVRARLDEATGT